MYTPPLKVSNLQNADKPTQTTGTLFMNAAQNKSDFMPEEKVINVDEMPDIEVSHRPVSAQSGSVSGKPGKVPSEAGSAARKGGKAPSESGSMPRAASQAGSTSVSSKAGSTPSNKGSSSTGHAPTPQQLQPDHALDTPDDLSIAPTVSTSVPEPEPAPSTSLGGSMLDVPRDTSLSRSRRSIPSANDVISLNRDMFMSETNTETSEPATSGFIGQLDDGFSSNIEYVNPRPIPETSDTVTTESDSQDTILAQDYEPYHNPGPDRPRASQDPRLRVLDDPYYTPVAGFPHDDRGSRPETDSDLLSELPSTAEPSEKDPYERSFRAPSVESFPGSRNVPIHVTSVAVSMEDAPARPIIQEDHNVVTVRF